jgi:predicted DCC family thiol-disulfide oxidoreductase YuxK
MSLSRCQNIILFDGVCVLCSRWSQFVTERDVERRFRFVAIQSPQGHTIAERCNIDPDNPMTFALVTEGDAVHVRSDAVLRILGMLPGWGWTAVLRIIPTRLRDKLYDLVARNRYRWFGRLDACVMPHQRGD